MMMSNNNLETNIQVCPTLNATLMQKLLSRVLFVSLSYLLNSISLKFKQCQCQVKENSRVNLQKLSLERRKHYTNVYLHWFMYLSEISISLSHLFMLASDLSASQERFVVAPLVQGLAHHQQAVMEEYSFRLQT